MLASVTEGTRAPVESEKSKGGEWGVKNRAEMSFVLPLGSATSATKRNPSTSAPAALPHAVPCHASRIIKQI
ncbi:hypothetical protein OPV22_010301 [Ensete ventricosum]|uniref:Uncharacterized protein n=1 Tax=Ensete ventricosum TaxID=4639 RepID=A0AAV8PVB2_ENSVE|nr:hypothetical protein OPV22_010301 [Ensete ventricosum]